MDRFQFFFCKEFVISLSVTNSISHHPPALQRKHKTERRNTEEGSKEHLEAKGVSFLQGALEFD